MFFYISVIGIIQFWCIGWDFNCWLNASSTFQASSLVVDCSGIVDWFFKSLVTCISAIFGDCCRDFTVWDISTFGVCYIFVFANWSLSFRFSSIFFVICCSFTFCCRFNYLVAFYSNIFGVLIVSFIALLSFSLRVVSLCVSVFCYFSGCVLSTFNVTFVSYMCGI